MLHRDSELGHDTDASQRLRAIGHDTDASQRLRARS